MKGTTFTSYIRQGLHPALMSDECGGEPMQPRPVDSIASAWNEIEHGGTAPTGETVTFDVALRMWTLWAAQCTLQNFDRGSIAVGKLGDFAVLSGDSRQLRSSGLFDLSVPRRFERKIVYG